MEKLMSEKHKRILASQLELIVNCLSPNPIVNRLMARKIIHTDEAQQIYGVQTESDRSRDLIKLLMEKDELGFEVFKEACDEFAMGHIARILREADEPLDERRKQLLEANKSTLVDRLNHIDVVNSMVWEGHMSPAERDRIVGFPSGHEGSLQLMEWLTEASVGAFTTLLNMLRSHQQFVLVGLLDKVPAQASEGTAATASSSTQVLTEELWKVKLYITVRRLPDGSKETNTSIWYQLLALQTNAFGKIASWCTENGAKLDGFERGCLCLNVLLMDETSKQKLNAGLSELQQILENLGIRNVKITCSESPEEPIGGRPDVWTFQLRSWKKRAVGDTSHNQATLYKDILELPQSNEVYTGIVACFEPIHVTVDGFQSGSLIVKLSCNLSCRNEVMKAFNTGQIKNQLYNLFSQYGLLGSQCIFRVDLHEGAIPMTGAHKETITRNFDVLAANLLVDGIFNKLISESIISYDDSVNIKQNSPTERASALLGLILKREDRAFYVLKEACEKNEMKHLAALLTD